MLIALVIVAATVATMYVYQQLTSLHTLTLIDGEYVIHVFPDKYFLHFFGTDLQGKQHTYKLPLTEEEYYYWYRADQTAMLIVMKGWFRKTYFLLDSRTPTNSFLDWLYNTEAFTTYIRLAGKYLKQLEEYVHREEVKNVP